MSSTGVGTDTSTGTPEVGSVDMKLEVVTLAVSDVDRAKAFYQSLGWRLDADIVRGENFRVVQVTPPHSACSVSFGKGVTTAEPGSAQRLILAVDDIDAARETLVRRGPRSAACSTSTEDPSPDPTPKDTPTKPTPLQRPRRQRLAAPRDQDTAPRPRIGKLTMDIAALAELLHKPPAVTAGSRRSPHHTTGGIGTPPTWTPASAATPPTRPPPPPDATWPTSNTSSSPPPPAPRYRAPVN